MTGEHENLVALRAEGTITTLERTHDSSNLVKRSPLSFDIYISVTTMIVTVWLGTSLHDEVAKAQNGLEFEATSVLQDDSCVLKVIQSNGLELVTRLTAQDC